MTAAAETITHERFATTWDDEPREVRDAYDELVHRLHGRYCLTHQFARLTGGPTKWVCEFGHTVRLEVIA